MDLISHGLWSGILAKAVNKKKLTKKPIDIKWFILWSAVPDVFTFALLFSWFLGSILLGYTTFSKLPHYQITEPMPENVDLILGLTNWFYNFSHSLIIFVIVFSLVYLFRKKIPWALAGWLVHILIDIPTHSYNAYPTPFLWPLSQWKVDGWAWSTWHFELVNLAVLIIAYSWFFQRWLKRKEKKLLQKN